MDDEDQAGSTENDVSKCFGSVRASTNLSDAEALHIEAIHALFSDYDVAIPENTW